MTFAQEGRVSRSLVIFQTLDEEGAGLLHLLADRLARPDCDGLARLRVPQVERQKYRASPKIVSFLKIEQNIEFS